MRQIDSLDWGSPAGIYDKLIPQDIVSGFKKDYYCDKLILFDRVLLRQIDTCDEMLPTGNYDRLIPQDIVSGFEKAHNYDKLILSRGLLLRQIDTRVGLCQ